MIDLTEISNSALAALIDEWIKGERERAILKRRLIDGICYEPLAEEFGLSVDRIKQIVYKQQDILFRRIERPDPDTVTAFGYEWAAIPT